TGRRTRSLPQIARESSKELEGDMDAVFTQVASSAVLGILTWLGGQLLNWLRGKHAGGQNVPGAQWSPGVPGMPPQARASASSVDVAQVVIYVGILEFIANIIGGLVGLLYRQAVGNTVDLTSTSSVQTYYNNLLSILLVTGTLTLIGGFYIIGRRVQRSVR